MARYHEAINRYKNLAPELLALIPAENHEQAVELIARLVNAGVVCNPRATQGTVRLNIVNGVCEGIPVTGRLVETPKPYGTGTYKALHTTYTGHKEAA